MTQNNEATNPKHYNQHKIEPWTYIRQNKLDYFEGNVIKYVSRHKHKGGRVDLEKAKTYLEEMLGKYDELYS